MKLRYVAVVATFLVSAALAGTVTVIKTGDDSPPCLKPNAFLLYTDVIPSAQALERFVRSQDAIAPGKDFNYALDYATTTPGKVAGKLTLGNGYVEFFGIVGFSGRTASFDFTVTQDCRGGPWRVTRFEQVKPPAGKQGAPGAPAVD